MGIVRHFREFLLRKRSWYWLLAAALLALAGHWLESHEVLQPLHQQTVTLHDSLESVQPFQIANYYSEVEAQGGGLWLGQWVHDIARPASGTNDGNIVWLLRSALARLLETPPVAVRVWHETGWYSGALFAASLLLIVLIMRGVWKDAERNNEAAFAFLSTLALIGFGPWLAGGIAWAAMQLLILCVALFGKILGGLATIVSTFGGAYKALSYAFGVLREADTIEGHSKLVAEDVAKLRGDPPT